MKRVSRYLFLCAIATLSMLPALAQPALPTDNAGPTPVVSEAEANYALYRRFLDTYETDQLTAYNVAKEYLRRFPQDNIQSRYLRRWVDEYVAFTKRTRKWLVKHLIEEKRFGEGFALGKEFLAANPEDVDTIYVLIDGALMALTDGNKAFVPDAATYAKLALQLIESGQIADHHGNTFAKLNFDLAIFTIASAPAESAKYICKAMQHDAFKNDAFTYSVLADAILGSQYTPLQREYETRFPTLEERDSAEARAEMAKLTTIADRIIDALARAVALAGSDPSLAQRKALWMETLTQFYKFRNNDYDTGLIEFIERILKKPMPPLQ